MLILTAAHLSPSAILLGCSVYFYVFPVSRFSITGSCRSGRMLQPFGARVEIQPKKKKKLMVREQHMEGRDSGIACLG